MKIWKDMEADHLRMGMSKDEIVDMLGEPENRSETKNTFIYCLGPRIIDYDSYAIDFDDNDRVVNYRYLPG